MNNKSLAPEMGNAAEGTVVNAIAKSYLVETTKGTSIELVNNWLTREKSSLMGKIGMFTRLKLEKVLSGIWMPTEILHKPSNLEVFFLTYSEQIRSGKVTSVPVQYLGEAGPSLVANKGDRNVQIKDIPADLLPEGFRRKPELTMAHSYHGIPGVNDVSVQVQTAIGAE